MILVAKISNFPSTQIMAPVSALYALTHDTRCDAAAFFRCATRLFGVHSLRP
jgi:hypothetical protein